jgi:iron(III) transport system ATP-binding protein
LLDEPLSNLDAKLRLEMRAELKRIHEEIGATIVFVTHDQWEAMTLATTIAVMSEGELQQLGTPDDIYERPANRFVAEFVGNLPINIIDFKDGTSGPLIDWGRDMVSPITLADNPASVGIRPESVRLVRADESGRRASVVDVVPTGGSWIVELSVDGDKFFAITPETPIAGRGSQVGLSVGRESLHIFDAAGRRLEA